MTSITKVSNSPVAVDLEGLHGGCIIEFRRQVDWIAFIALIVTETSWLITH